MTASLIAALNLWMDGTRLKVWCESFFVRVAVQHSMEDYARGVLVVGATSAAIVIPFLIVPEVLERRGYDPRSRLVRALVWASFLAIVLIPAAASGLLLSVTNPVDWLIFGAAMIVAVLYDYYRLNPSKVPWGRARA